MIYVDTIFDAPIPTSDAKDTIDWWLEQATGEIEYRTGVAIDQTEFEDAFIDRDWWYLSENDDGIEMIDMNVAEDVIDGLTEKYIREIKKDQRKSKRPPQSKIATPKVRMPK